MDNMVRLIIEIPEETYEYWKTHKDEYVLAEAIKNGIPLDNNLVRSEIQDCFAEVQAYFAGEAYGWEEGRKALIEDLKAEIRRMEYHMIDCDVLVNQEDVLDILDNINKESEE